MDSAIVIPPCFFPLLRPVIFPRAVTAVNVHKHSSSSSAHSGVFIVMM